MTCASPLNTRIFASDFQFGGFRAFLRGVVVKKIHIFLNVFSLIVYIFNKVFIPA